MQVKSIAECSKGSILQYFWPSLSYCLLLRCFFVYFWVAFYTGLLYFYFLKNDDDRDTSNDDDNISQV